MHGEMNILLILLNSGIVVKIVLILLVIASILSWAIVFQKKKTFAKIEEENQKFTNFFEASSSLEDIFEQSKVYTNSSLSLMFQKGYLELAKIKEKLNNSGQKEKIQSYIRDYGIGAIERSLAQGASISNQVLEKRLETLASISSVAPFVGLFGTVWGIINSFTGLASGGGSIEAVAPGIAEALVATAVGLAAAIPANWFFNIYTNRIMKQNSEMEAFGQDFLNMIERSTLSLDSTDSVKD
jgi:biopolymer transport protein TolQ